MDDVLISKQPGRTAIGFWALLCGALVSLAAPQAATPMRPQVSSRLPADPPLPVPRPGRAVRPTPIAPSRVAPTPVAPIPLPAPAATAPKPAPPVPGAAPGTGAATPAADPARQGVAAPDCLARLTGLGVTVARIAVPAQPDPRCVVADPVRLTGMTLRDGTAVAFPDEPTLACATASVLTAYVRDLLGPLAKGSYGASIEAAWTGPGLECRTRDHLPGAALSAHAQGLAVDITQVRLTDKRLFEVGRPKGEHDIAFEQAARAGACGYFHTTLGPGTDRFHETHWHFDLLARGRNGDAKVCE